MHGAFPALLRSVPFHPRLPNGLKQTPRLGALTLPPSSSLAHRLLIPDCTGRTHHTLYPLPFSPQGRTPLPPAYDRMSSCRRRGHPAKTRPAGPQTPEPGRPDTVQQPLRGGGRSPLGSPARPPSGPPVALSASPVRSPGAPRPRQLGRRASPVTGRGPAQRRPVTAEKLGQAGGL